MTIYLGNAFSPNMLQLPADVSFKPITVEELCEAIHGKIINTVGHQGTISLINLLCNTNLQVNRASVKVNIGDMVYIVMLGFRLEEGKIMTSEEVLEAYHQGKIMLIKVEVYGSVLEELVKCQGLCEEREYDTLAYRAKGEA